MFLTPHGKHAGVLKRLRRQFEGSVLPEGLDVYEVSSISQSGVPRFTARAAGGRGESRGESRVEASDAVRQVVSRHPSMVIRHSLGRRAIPRWLRRDSGGKLLD